MHRLELAQLGGGLGRDGSREAVAGWIVLARPGVEDGVGLHLGRPQPRVRVPLELRRVSRLGGRPEKEGLPLDGDTLAVLVCQLCEAHGPDVAPRSEVVGPDLEPDGAVIVRGVGGLGHI